MQDLARILLSLISGFRSNLRARMHVRGQALAGWRADGFGVSGASRCYGDSGAIRICVSETWLACIRPPGGVTGRCSMPSSRCA